MPTPKQLTNFEVDFSGGFYPSAPDLSPEGVQRTIKAGSNVFLRSNGKVEVANGLSELSSTNVGARIFAADIQRAVIAGGLVGSRLPYAGLLRYQNAILLFLSENISAQVFLNEVAVSGLTTSATAGKLRVAIPDGVGGYNTFDAGFDKPSLGSASVTVFTGGTSVIERPMVGRIGVALAPWRTKGNAIGPPSDIIYNDIPPTTGSIIRIVLPSAVSGQDGWIYCGTRWRDDSGTLKVVRYIYNQPRGTFTATNGSNLLTAGVGTRWNRDLFRRDIVTIDGSNYVIDFVTSDTTATLLTNFTGVTNPGKTMTMVEAVGSWYDGELGVLINRDAIRAPRAAGVISYGGFVLLWGVPDPTNNAPTAVTGNAIIAMLQDNPEHVGPLGIATASGSDLVNVLGGDGPLYLMTTTSLEAVSFTGDPKTPYIIRVIAEPGFKDTTNAALYKDWLYFFNNKPCRTRARENIDVEFARPVWERMRTWTGRVIVQVDPDNDAVLYMHDDGAVTEVIPWMAQLERWSPPLNFSARIADAAVVNGKLDVTYLSSGNYRVNQWEGGSGIGGTRYSASQFYDPEFLNRNRVKRLVATGKMGSVSVYSATPDAAVPDVNNLGAATQTFTLSNTDKTEPEIYTNLEGRAHAFRVDFSSNDGSFDKLIVRGVPKAEGR